ncbi:(deoxy)nucleoside triphosphate pyrophosphohydrolase [Sporichthya sp.]|uniref:(deoxy)nucleoside triphosphate pyrophosphohydrolase n=1 Tax=Sporichthya sp. TaxID=65475 RepID=UPI0025FCA8E4|nr:(deoxy)nucleoside triphosphate pyrophosphohydrolase [Sporichthya sp.]
MPDGPRVVVGAAIVRDGYLLAARRNAPAALAGGWELPGGKVEPGESETEALIRECQEELGVVVVPGERVPGEWPLRDDLVLRVYLAELVEGEPAPLEDHDELRWLAGADLFEVAWLPADVPAVTAFRRFSGLG